MTEAEWLECKESGPMLQFIEPRVSDRKLHCFAIACARRITPLLIHPASSHAVDALERFVEGPCDPKDFRQLIEQLWWDVEGAAFCVDAGGAPWQDVAEQLPETFLAELVADPLFQIHSARAVLSRAAHFVFNMFSPVPSERGFRNRPVACFGGPFRPVFLVHEVFGNPFRKVKLNKAWRTSTVVALARGMYDTRDFAPMPILADALQDAGCDHSDILGHCRDPHGTHVRGCWVVDLVLGKE